MMNLAHKQPPTRSWKSYGALFVLVFVTAAWTAFSRGLYSDDFILREHHADHGIAASLFRKSFRPLEGAVRGILYAATGGQVGWIHVLAASIHALNCTLLFRLLLSRGTRASLAFLLVALFAFHPSASEAVFWTVCLPHYLLAMLAFLAAALIVSAKRKAFRLHEVLILAALGYFSMALHETFFALFLILLPGAFVRWKSSSSKVRVAFVAAVVFVVIGALATHIILLRADRARVLEGFQLLSGGADVLRLIALRSAGEWTWDLGEAAVARFLSALVAAPLRYFPWFGVVGAVFYVVAKGRSSMIPSRADTAQVSQPPTLSSVMRRMTMPLLAAGVALFPFVLMPADSRYLPPRFIYLWMVPTLLILADGFEYLFARLESRSGYTRRYASIGGVAGSVIVLLLASSMMGAGIQYADCTKLQDAALGGLANFVRQNPGARGESIHFVELPTKVGLAKTFVEPWATEPAIRSAFEKEGIEPPAPLNVVFHPRIDTSEIWGDFVSGDSCVSCLYVDDGSFHYWREIEMIDAPGEIPEILRPRPDAPAPATLRIERWSSSATPISDEPSFRLSGVEAWTDSAGPIYFILELEPLTRADPKNFHIEIRLEDEEGKVTELETKRMRKNRGNFRAGDGVFRYRLDPSRLPAGGPLGLSIQIEKDDRLIFRHRLLIDE